MSITTAFSDPSVTGPNLLFNNGQVSGITELYDPETDAVSGGEDYSWSVTQWSADEYFNPSVLSANIFSTTLGTSIANWTTNDGQNGFAVFGTPANYTYQIMDNGGSMKDVYLQTVDSTPLGYTFDKQVTFTVNEGIVATVGTSSDGPTSIANSFTVEFNRPGSPNYNPILPTISMFLQFGLADQRGLPGVLYGDGMYNVAPAPGNNNEALRFVADGVMHEVTIDLSAGVAQMATAMFRDQYTSQIQQAGSSILDLSNWSLTSEYIGPEAIGSTGVTLDVSHPIVTRDDSITVTEATAAAKTQIVSVIGGVNDNGQVDGASNPAAVVSQNIPALKNIPLNPVISDTSDGLLFPQLSISDPTYSSSLTAVVTIGDITKGSFDITDLPSVLTANFGMSLGTTALLSNKGDTLTITGSAVNADLRALRFVPTTQTDGTITSEAITLTVTNSSGTASATETMTIQGSFVSPIALTIIPPAVPVVPAYTYNGAYYVVDNDSTKTALIDRTLTTAATDIFGGQSQLSYIGGNAIIVMNGSGQTGGATIASTGGNQIWMGSGLVNYTAGGHSQFLLADENNVSSTLNITAGTETASLEIDVWGSGDTTQTVDNTSLATAVVFGGGSNLNYIGGDSTIVLNGNGQTGVANITSLGGNTVWAGTAELNFAEGSGNDTIILGGSSNTIVQGTNETSGTTTILNNGSTGTFTYDGSSKTSDIFLTNGLSTVSGGFGHETINLNGIGSLVVNDAAAATGRQDITIENGSLQFTGNSGAADIMLGTGRAYITAGSGNTTLTGGSGYLDLDLKEASNVDVNLNGLTAGSADIFNFLPKATTISVSDVAGSQITSGNLVLSLHDGATVIFHNVSSDNGITFN